MDQPPPAKRQPATAANPARETPRPPAKPDLPLTVPFNDTTTELGKPTPVDQLTPAEQMARFEKELKEQDWGHQPC